jgi:hypothetical protein
MEVVNSHSPLMQVAAIIDKECIKKGFVSYSSIMYDTNKLKNRLKQRYRYGKRHYETGYPCVCKMKHLYDEVIYKKVEEVIQTCEPELGLNMIDKICNYNISLGVYLITHYCYFDDKTERKNADKYFDYIISDVV